ncbi:Group-specific protein [Caenorhabditis elegans]|uniref:Group-specific protein n=1 Tax=Caenorhabditis elegans TaxID=6239 RepID=O45477_CAEEL|nr:Group-specific protein [Caenorhabditis elegans]CAB04338.2 Group-specific protein [Caenorhabditis elegans]|eukprot:NP_507003.2 Uncharacterized protein CELE_F36G9.7 [Caenorhabditis elegans]
MTSDLIVHWESSLLLHDRHHLVGSIQFLSERTNTKKMIRYAIISITNIILLGIAVLFLYVGIRDNSWSGTLDPSFYIPTCMIVVAVLIFIDRLIYWKHKFDALNFEVKFPRPRSSIRKSNKEQVKQWETDKSNRSSSKKLMNFKVFWRIIVYLVILIGTFSALYVLHISIHTSGFENPYPILYSIYFGFLALFVYFCMFVKFVFLWGQKKRSTSPESLTSSP